MSDHLRDMDRKPWFGEYELCKMPNTMEPYPNEPVHKFLDVAAKKYPNSGIVQLGTMMKYGEIRNHVLRLAAALTGLGVEKGDRVATILPTCIQFAISDYAISRTGAVHIPASFLEPEYVLEHKFKEGSPKVLICLADDPNADVNTAKSLARKTGIETVIVTKVEDYSPAPPDHEKIDDTLWFTDLIKDNPPSSSEVEIDNEKDLETLLFSGGTTGLPKGCMLTHKNILANVLQTVATFGPLVELLNGKFSVLIGIPFYHAYGHVIMHTITHTGATQLLVTDARDTKSMISMIKKYYPILQFGVPTQYMNMLKEELDEISILGVSGSAALPPEIQEKFENKSKGGLMEGYGLSECSPNTHFNPSLTIRMLGGRNKTKLQEKVSKLVEPVVKLGLGTATRYIDAKIIGKGFAKILPVMMNGANKPERKKDDKRGSIGIPFVDTQIKITGDDGTELSSKDLIEGKIGEMYIKGPQRMLGYWPEPGTGLDEEGYVHTGDVVRMDKNGYFYIVDRVKDMIIISGLKVYSREIDDILYNHPAVDIAATIGVPDPDRPGSERVKVYIQLKDEYKGKVKEEEFIQYLKDKVAKYAVPQKINFIDNMPLTGVQKVDKKTLRTMEETSTEVG